jgi:hypothetical protein
MADAAPAPVTTAPALPDELDAPALPDELLFCIFRRLNISVIRRLCLVKNRGLYASVQKFMGTTIYAAWLARSMLSYCSRTIQIVHNGVYFYSVEYCDCKFSAQAAEDYIAIALTGRPAGSLAGWAKADYLRLLYPGATQLPHWPHALHALEWCARHERDILGTDGGPRREILALLRPDVIARLESLAENFASQNEEFKILVQMALRHVGGRECGPIDLYIDSIMSSTANSNDCGVFANVVVLAIAAVERRRGACDSLFREVMQNELSKLLHNCRETYRNKFSESDKAWLALAGFVELRNMHRLLNTYECDTPRPVNVFEHFQNGL